MSIHFGNASISQLLGRPNTVAKDKVSGISFRPLRAEAIEGGRLQKMPLNGIEQRDPFGKPVLRIMPSAEPVYFRIQGSNASTNRPVDLIVPFDNLGQTATTQQLDILV